MDNASIASVGGAEAFTISDSRIGKSGDVKRCYGSIIESVIDGNIFDNNTDDTGAMTITYSNINAGCTIEDCAYVVVTDSVVRSQVTITSPNVVIVDSIVSAGISTTGDVTLSNTELNAALSGGNDHTYTDSVVYNSATSTPTTIQTVREAKNKITGSCYVGAGQFTVANGASYSPPSIVSGCVMTVIRANGVSVDSESTGPELTAHRTGWHRFIYNASALCQVNALDLESIVCVNGTPVQAGYNRKTYPTYDSFINSGVSVDLNMTAGDVVTMQYKHSNGTPVTHPWTDKHGINVCKLIKYTKMADNSLPKVAERSLPDAAMANVTHVRVVSTDNSEKLPIANFTLAGTKVTVAVDGLSGTVDGAFEDVLIQIAGKADTTQVEALDAEKLDIANVYNALDKTVDGFALDARQGKALDDAMVHKTGNESIDGIKTFTSSPVVPTPTTDYQAATKAYADSLVVGLLDYRGGFDASVNAYPSSGGSGTGGAILKGDMWVVSVGGRLTERLSMLAIR